MAPLVARDPAPYLSSMRMWRGFNDSPCQCETQSDAAIAGWLRVLRWPGIASPAALNDVGRDARSLVGTLTKSLLLALCVAAPAAAQTQHKPAAPAKPPAATAPKELGKFDDWTAATHQESGQTVCYAFTRAKNSTPALPGRGEVILTVTERPAGRDAVAISGGFDYPKGAAVTVQVETTGLDFYTAQRNAFARENKAAISAFERGTQASARAPGPRDGQVVVDTFSLHGFSAAYAAINKACPAR